MCHIEWEQNNQRKGKLSLLWHWHAWPPPPSEGASPRTPASESRCSGSAKRQQHETRAGAERQGGGGERKKGYDPDCDRPSHAGRETQPLSLQGPPRRKSVGGRGPRGPASAQRFPTRRHNRNRAWRHTIQASLWDWTKPHTPVKGWRTRGMDETEQLQTEVWAGAFT